MPTGLRLPAVTNAAVDALKADSALTTLLGGTAKVYAYVPEDVAPPYVVVLSANEERWAPSFNDQDARMSVVEVQAWSNYRGTLQVDNICSQALSTLLTESTWSGITGYAGVEFWHTPIPTPPQQIAGTVWYQRILRVRVFFD